jgi:hypothetical protein
MSNIYKTSPKATVCKGNTCVTIYGEAAKALQAIVVTTVLILAFVLLVKAIS